MAPNDERRERPDARYRALLDAAGDAVAVLDERGTVQSFNSGAERIFGYAADEVVGKSITLLIPEGVAVPPPVSAPADCCPDAASVAGRRRDGSSFPLSVTLAQWRSGDRRFVTGVMRDISGRARAETALERDPSRYEQLVRGIRDYALLLLDPSGHIVTWNRGAERITGWSEPEIIGMHFAVLLSPAAAARDTAMALLGEARRRRHQAEREISRKDGATLTANMSLSPLRSEERELSGFVVVMRDVTEQRRVAQDRQRLASIIDASPELVAVTDPKGELLFLNPTARRLFGWLSADPAAPAATTRLWPREFRRMLMREAMPAACARGSWSGEGSVPGGGGEAVPMLLTVMAHKDGNGAVSHFSVLGRDITERKRAEEHQRRLMREVDHRAKNALAVVQSILRLSRARDTRSFVRAVEGRIAALARVHTLVALNRWESAEIGAIVEAELEAMDGAVRRQVQMDGGALELTTGAAQAVALTLHELTTNACRHGALTVPSGNVAIAWRLVDGEHGKLELSWIESGGVKPAAAASRGFGFDIIRAMVEDQLEGRILLDWLAGGLRCVLRIPSRFVLRPAAD
jgi:PAS domain S-box-containing protein